MKHTPTELIAAIDRHAPRDWRRSPVPEPRLLFLEELGIFALPSTAFSRGHLWNDAWADPSVGFPIMAARHNAKSYLTTHPDKTQGVIHFGPEFASEIGQMKSLGPHPAHLENLIARSLLSDDVFQDAELFWIDERVRLRFLTD